MPLPRTPQSRRPNRCHRRLLEWQTSGVQSGEGIEELIRRCNAHPDAFFAGEREESVVAAAEAALGYPLPAAYRTFVLRLGAGSVGSSEIYGVISEPFDGPIPDAVWSTIKDRLPPSNLPDRMVVIGDDGMGGSYVLDTAEGNDPPVRVWNGGRSMADDELQLIAPSFEAHLRAILERVWRR